MSGQGRKSGEGQVEILRTLGSRRGIISRHIGRSMNWGRSGEGTWERWRAGGFLRVSNVSNVRKFQAVNTSTSARAVRSALRSR